MSDQAGLCGPPDPVPPRPPTWLPTPQSSRNRAERRRHLALGRGPAHGACRRPRRDLDVHRGHRRAGAGPRAVTGFSRGMVVRIFARHLMTLDPATEDVLPHHILASRPYLYSPEIAASRHYPLEDPNDDHRSPGSRETPSTLFCSILRHSKLSIRDNFLPYRPTRRAERVNRL